MITVSSDASVFQTADFERNLKRHRGTAWSWQLTDRALRDVACLAWSKQKKLQNISEGTQNGLVNVINSIGMGFSVQEEWKAINPSTRPKEHALLLSTYIVAHKTPPSPATACDKRTTWHKTIDTKAHSTKSKQQQQRADYCPGAPSQRGRSTYAISAEVPSPHPSLPPR